jgi:predicted secreted protein
MFIEVVSVESRNHPYGDPDIEVAKIALRTFIKHRPGELRATIPVGEHEFIIWRVDEITMYEYETFSYKTFKASAWSVPPEGVRSECTTTYEFRTFVDEAAFVISTSPTSQGFATHVHGDVAHSFFYWRSIEGKKVIAELVSLSKQEEVIANLVSLAKTKQDVARFDQADLDEVIERAESWLRRTSYDML